MKFFSWYNLYDEVYKGCVLGGCKIISNNGGKTCDTAPVPGQVFIESTSNGEEITYTLDSTLHDAAIGVYQMCCKINSGTLYVGSS